MVESRAERRRRKRLESHRDEPEPNPPPDPRDSQNWLNWFKSHWGAVLLFTNLVSFVLGPGFVWQYKQWTFQKDTLHLEVLKQVNDAQQQIMVLARDLLDLSITERDDATYVLKADMLMRQASVATENYAKVEAKLAALEGREPRTFDLIAPLRPTIKVQ